MPDAPTPEMLLADRRWIEDLARRLVRDPNAADDVAQETWRRVLERPPVRLTSPRGWLRAVVRSCAREQRRSDARRGARERAASRPEATPGAAQLVARADAQRRVLAEVLALDPASREVVLLRYFEDLEPWQIARRLGAPQGTVRSRLHRALAVLRERLDDEHGGDRAAWGAALLGPGWRTATPSAGRTTVSKGVFVMTTQVKVVLGAGAAAALLFLWWRADAAPPAPQPPKSQPEEAAAPVPRAARRTGPDGETVSDTKPPSGETVSDTVSPPAAVASGPRRLPVRLIELTAPDATPDAGGGAGRSGEITDDEPAAGGVMLGGGMTIEASGWTKWKPVPEKGTAALFGKVVDSTGAPLAGAEILRVEAATGGAEGDVRDFRHITTIGVSAADGTFAFESQPARAYRLAANWHLAMSRPRGLLLGGLVAVEPQEKQTLDGLVLRLPIDRRDFGTVTGRVLDDEGSPVEVGVSFGLLAAKTGADGRFRLEPVAAGDGEVAVDDYDFKPFRRAVTVRAGAETEVEVRLAPKLSGPHEIDGFVRDTDGSPVAGVPILCGGIQDLYRRRTTAADGSFRFRRLPSPPAGESFSLSVFSDGIVLKTVGGIAAPTHGLVFEVERSVKLRLLIRDATTAAALPLFNVTISRAVEEGGATVMEPVVVTTLHEEDGTWTAEVPRGALTLLIEAPEHRGFNGTVDVPREGADFEALIEMQR